MLGLLHRQDLKMGKTANMLYIGWVPDLPVSLFSQDLKIIYQEKLRAWTGC